MGKNLDRILAEARDGALVGVTVVTNQDNGIASYGSGSLVYHPASFVGPFFRPARLSTTGGDPLKYYLSDRMLDIDPPPSPGTFGHSPRQPFSAVAVDKVGVSVSSVLVRARSSSHSIRGEMRLLWSQWSREEIFS